MDTIISSVITGVVAIVVCLIQQNKTSALIQYKLDELQKHVEKHNQVIERTYELERRADLLEEKQKVANHRIDDLEKEN